MKSLERVLCHRGEIGGGAVGGLGVVTFSSQQRTNSADHTCGPANAHYCWSQGRQ